MRRADRAGRGERGDAGTAGPQTEKVGQGGGGTPLGEDGEGAARVGLPERRDSVR